MIIFSCWMDSSVYTLILSGPVCVSLVGNLVFFTVILYVLIRKLRSSKSRNGSESSWEARKAIRATFILSPLLGIPYLLYPITPQDNNSLKFYYHITSAAFSSFQVNQSVTHKKWCQCTSLIHPDSRPYLCLCK